MGDDGETQLIHSSEMDHLAKEFAEEEVAEVPSGPTVPGLC